MSEAELEVKTSHKLARPTEWNVIMYNDDFTPFDFVISVLVHLFNRSEDEAESLARMIHDKGQAVVGTYYKEIAEMKRFEAVSAAARNQHPLRLETSRV